MSVSPQPGPSPWLCPPEPPWRLPAPLPSKRAPQCPQAPRRGITAPRRHLWGKAAHFLPFRAARCRWWTQLEQREEAATYITDSKAPQSEWGFVLHYGRCNQQTPFIISETPHTEAWWLSPTLAFNSKQQPLPLNYLSSDTDIR